jgi:DNA primase
VYFPFYELGGTKPIYFVGRSILSCFPRYWNPPLDDFLPHRKSTVLWGLHRFQKPLSQAVICEGIFSACHEADRVAVLGKTVSDEQIKLIRQICTEEAIVCLDGGECMASGVMAYKLCHETSLKISVVHLPEGKDPDDLRDIAPWVKQRERIA